MGKDALAVHVPRSAVVGGCVRWLQRLVLAGAIAGLAVTAMPLSGRAGKPEDAREYLLKAAFVYNFTKFVEWPATAFATDRSPLVVCIHGQEAFGHFATAMRGKSVANRPIEVVDAHRSGAPASCHVAFLDGEDGADARTIAQIEAAGGLSVSDAPDFVHDGGMVGLLTIENKMRFEVNLAASRKTGIRIHAALLRLAKTVIE